MNESQPTAQSSSRMPWLDAMRGMTMILVVAYHVAQFGFQENEKTSAALPFLMLFRMPLFFFVSGFLAHKARFNWNITNTLSLLWKKMKIQIIPALIFLSVFIIFKVNGKFWDGFLAAMKNPTKSGYWFTWVLLHMFIIYYVLSMMGYFIRRHICDNKVVACMTWILLWLLSIAAYETLYMPRFFTYHKTNFFTYSSLVQTIRFTQFFLLGNIVHRYWNRVQRLFDSRWFFPIVTVTAAVCCADIFRWHTMKMMWTNLPRTMAMYCLMLLVVMFFRHCSAWFTPEQRLGKGLIYIGTRTLDVYLLHFLFIPHVPAIGTWLNVNHPNFLLDILLSVGIALPVVGFCLLISRLLHTSPALGRLLFGK